MPWFKRRDGTYIRDLPAFTKIMPYLMPDKAGSVIYYQEDYDVTETLDFLKAWNRAHLRETGAIATLFEVVLAAAARAVALRPRVNRFLAGKRYYQRNRILLSFVAKKEITDEGKEVNIKMPFWPDDTLAQVARRTRDYVKKGISADGHDNEKIVDAAMKLPRPVVRLLNWLYDKLDELNLLPYALTESDPMWSTIFLANVGSFGLDPPFHHLFERGTCPIFMAVGKVRTVQRLAKADDGTPRIEERKTLRVNYSFDDRIADGVYMGKVLALARGFIENPSLLTEPPAIAPETLAELALVPKD